MLVRLGNSIWVPSPTAAVMLVIIMSAVLSWVMPALARNSERSQWQHFKFLHNLVTVDVHVNGKGPFRFILDSASEVSIITPSLAAKIVSTSTSRVRLFGPGTADVAARQAAVKTISIGDAVYHDQSFYVAPLPEELNDVPRGVSPIQGILGSDVMSRRRTTVDYERQRVRMEREEEPVDVPGKPVPIRFWRGNIPVVVARIDGIPAYVTVDSGSGGPLTLFRPFVAAHNFEAKYRPHVAIIAGKNIGGDVRARITRARHVQIGDFEVVEPITEFLLQSGRQPINDALAGSIGNAVLKRFTVTFDYARHVIFFAPNGDFAKRDIFDRAGIIVHRRADNRSFVVGEVIRQSSAYGAGIRANDRILKVDGVPAPGVDLDGMQAKMKQPVGTPLRLEVERDGRSRNVTLVLQEIL